MNSLVTQINSVLATAAADHGFTFVNVNAGFDGHRLCDTGVPWFQYNPRGATAPLDDLDATTVQAGLQPQLGDALLPVTLRGLFHPTAEGQMVYTQALAVALGCA